MSCGTPRFGAAYEQVQWTCESNERPERKRRAGELPARSSGQLERVAGERLPRTTAGLGEAPGAKMGGSQ